MATSSADDLRAVLPRRNTRMRELLDEIVVFYLRSEDFNGYAFGDRYDTSPSDVRAAVGLLKRSLIEVITDQDYVNPHIRPWPSGRSVEQQIQSVRDSPSGGPAVCLYPKPDALVALVDPSDFEGRPYELMMAMGGTMLQPIYLRPDVVEPYREDPRFDFQMHDFGFQLNLSDAFYRDASEPDSERVSLLHGGLAYNYPNPDAGPLKRAACVWLGDLCRFTPEFQMRWSTYQLEDQSEFVVHPQWNKMQMGAFPDGSTSLTRIFCELGLLNELHEGIYGQALFRTTAQPKEFSWLLRPSKREFDAFVHDLDKLLSDNFRPAAFDVVNVESRDDDGNQIGTLRRLDLFLEGSRVSEEQRSKVLAPFRTVRKLRQKPAHHVRENEHDPELIQRQVDLLDSVADSLFTLRRFWQTHTRAPEVSTFHDEGLHYRF